MNSGANLWYIVTWSTSWKISKMSPENHVLITFIGLWRVWRGRGIGSSKETSFSRLMQMSFWIFGWISADEMIERNKKKTQYPLSWQSVYLSVFFAVVPICSVLSVCPYLFLLFCMSVCLSVCLFVSVCLSLSSSTCHSITATFM